jgi:hypothetical protein
VTRLVLFDHGNAAALCIESSNGLKSTRITDDELANIIKDGVDYLNGKVKSTIKWSGSPSPTPAGTPALKERH